MSGAAIVTEVAWVQVRIGLHGAFNAYHFRRSIPAYLAGQSGRIIDRQQLDTLPWSGRKFRDHPERQFRSRTEIVVIGKPLSPAENPVGGERHVFGGGTAKVIEPILIA